MSKEDYQAIAAVIYRAMERQAMGDETLYPDAIRALRSLADDMANMLAADNTRFSRSLFIEACETGRCRGMRQVS